MNSLALSHALGLVHEGGSSGAQEEPDAEQPLQINYIVTAEEGLTAVLERQLR
jgi:hypothetical protein